jgi:hypothetical protein
LPALFVTAVVGWDAQEAHRDSLGRLAFIVSMMAFTVFAQRILSPNGGAFAEQIRRDPNRWLARLRYLWYPLGAGVPFILAGLAAVGYYYTARQLEGQLAATVWLVIGGVITHDLVIRWLILEQRKLAFAQAKEKRVAARVARATQAAARVSGAAAPIDLEIPVVDLPTITEQTRQLTRIVIALSVVLGLWFIWVQVLPALAILDHVTLWQYTVVVEGQEQQAARHPGQCFAGAPRRRSHGGRGAQSPWRAGDRCPATPVDRCGEPLRDHPGAALRHSHGRDLRCLQCLRGELVAGSMGGRRAGLGLWSAGDLREFHLRTDHLVGSTDPSG